MEGLGLMCYVDVDHSKYPENWSSIFCIKYQIQQISLLQCYSWRNPNHKWVFLQVPWFKLQFFKNLRLALLFLIISPEKKGKKGNIPWCFPSPSFPPFHPSLPVSLFLEAEVLVPNSRSLWPVNDHKWWGFDIEPIRYQTVTDTVGAVCALIEDEWKHLICL